MEKLYPKITNYFILSILFFLPIYLIKIKIGWLSSNALELLIGLLFIVQILNRQIKYKIFSTGYAAAVLLIFSGLFLSSIANRNYYVGFGAIKGWFIFPIVFGIVFYDALKKDGRLLKKSLLALFYSGAAVSLIGIMYKFSGIVTFDDRLKIYWNSPNQLAMFLAIPFLIGLQFTIQQQNRTSFYLIGLVLIGLNLFYTFSYGAWLALTVALFFIIWLNYSNKWQKKYLIILILAFVILISLASVYKYKSIANMGERSSLASRMAIWKSAGLMIENNPLFGIGPGNFQEKYLEYQKYFSPYLEWSAPQPHNIFLAFWLETGIVGLFGFAVLLYHFFCDNKKVIQMIPHTKTDSSIINEGLSSHIKKQAHKYFGVFGDGASRDFGILFLAIMIYILVHGMVDTTYWRNDLAVVFWMIITSNFYLSKISGNGRK